MLKRAFAFAAVVVLFGQVAFAVNLLTTWMAKSSWI
jgi:nitrogen fixation protein FixH